MPKFAVYFVPEAESDFYRFGASILGYDVRTCQAVRMLPELQEQLPDFKEDWVKCARPYGFHLTIGDSINFNPGTLSQIKHELSDILNCFGSKHPFILRRHEDEPVSIWGGQREIVVLRYKPNVHLRMFHALVVARINVLGLGSGYLNRYLSNPNQYAGKPHQALRIQKFYAPYVLSDYTPHFTLLNPYTGNEHNRIKQIFSKTFSRFCEISIASICLLVQMDEDDEWKIHKEFTR